MTITWPQNGWSKDEEAREAFTKEVTSVLGFEVWVRVTASEEGKKGGIRQQKEQMQWSNTNQAGRGPESGEAGEWRGMSWKSGLGSIYASPRSLDSLSKDGAYRQFLSREIACPDFCFKAVTVGGAMEGGWGRERLKATSSWIYLRSLASTLTEQGLRKWKLSCGWVTERIPTPWKIQNSQSMPISLHKRQKLFPSPLLLLCLKIPSIQSRALQMPTKVYRNAS